uniref:Uncharacterized protein n=1 Tax=Chenopodium quinoa TaxID=63459 RepID=A0A803NC95_CHEQI
MPPKLPPPPPHVVPTPPPAPGHHATIVIVFVSLGGVFFLAFLSAALFCFIKKRRKRMIKETDNITVDEHMHVHEEVVRGPHGEQAVLVTFEDDIHTHETKIIDEIVSGTSHARGAHHPHSLQTAAPTSGSDHLQIENKNS